VGSISRLSDHTCEIACCTPGFFHETFGNLASFDDVGMISQFGEVFDLLGQMQDDGRS
jgi:hypothetical protein